MSHRRGLFPVLVLLASAGCVPSPGGTSAGPKQATFGGGTDRNMVNLADKVVPTEWSVEEGKVQNVKWTADLGTLTYGGVVIYDGRVFIGTNNGTPRDEKVKAKHLA